MSGDSPCLSGPLQRQQYRGGFVLAQANPHRGTIRLRRKAFASDEQNWQGALVGTTWICPDEANEANQFVIAELAGDPEWTVHILVAQDVAETALGNGNLCVRKSCRSTI